MVSTNLALNISKFVMMLHAKVSSMIVMPDGALTMENESERPTIIVIKGVGLNLVVLPREALHLLQDGVIVELRTHENRALQVTSK